MARRNFTCQEILAALDEWDSGVTLGVVCQRHGMSEATLYRWRAARRTLDAAPEEPSATQELRRARAELAIASASLDALHVVVRHFLGPGELEKAARLVEARCRMSLRRARRLLGLAPRREVVELSGASPQSW